MDIYEIRMCRMIQRKAEEIERSIASNRNIDG